MKELDHTSFFINEWRVVPAEGVLARGDESVRLEPKAMQVLVYLASKPGQVISRDELERNVWQNELIGYGAVTNTVIKLRKALQDDSKNSRFIATIPKMGYQLVAAVTHAGPEDGVSRAIVADGSSPSVIQRSMPYRRAAAIMAVVTVALVYGFTFVWPIGARDDDNLPSIAVLPFETLGNDPAQGNLADGLTDDIITDLSRLSSVRVIAGTASSTFRGSQLSPEEIGTALNVTYVLKGSIRRLGSEIRINAQLINTRNGFNAWAQRYDTNIRQVFAVQDQVTQQIVSALAVKMTSEESGRLARRATNNLKAYDHFQEGQRLFFVNTKEAFDEADSRYRMAIDLDPQYGRAYGALAVVLAARVIRGWSATPRQEMDQALVLGKRAVELDVSTPQTHFALGFVYLVRRQYDEALQAAMQSVRIAPSYPDGYSLLGYIHMYNGNPREALAQNARGMRLDPYITHQYLIVQGGARYMLGDYAEAIKVLEVAEERNDNQILVKAFLAASYMKAGRKGDAEWVIERIRVISPTTTVSELDQSLPIADAGRKQALLVSLREAGLPP
jgi:TolB-like protein/DNA-binding winged helix-turn-helix (wHTH) protein/Flp pilus assembly protein TadD